MLLNSCLFKGFQCIVRTFTTRQSLSYEQATTALRPFYFAVHPDFFTKFPEEKSINENSLKCLNGFLNSVNQGHSTQPLQVGFYLRNPLEKTSDRTTLRFVTIKLHDRNFVSLVKSILSTCDLSQDYVNTLNNESDQQPLNASNYFDEDFEWDQFLRKWSSHHFKTSSGHVKSSNRVSPSDAIKWLKVSSELAREQQLQNMPVEKEIESITSDLCGSFNISDIVWTSDWNAISRRGCLASLHRFLLSSTNDRKFFESVLDSHRILFTSRGSSGLSILEDIVLNSVDVPASWYNSLAKINSSSRHVLNHKVPSQERLLSILLGGAEVSRFSDLHQSLLTEAYFTQLLFVNKRLAANIHRQGGAHIGHQYVQDNDFKQLRVALDDIGDIPTVSPQGYYLIPPRCPAFLIYDHMNHAPSVASRNSANYDQISNEWFELKSQCIYQLNLHHIDIESNVSLHQAVYCLQSILEALHYTTPITHELTDLSIKISQFYSVTSEGILTLPWNWKNL